MFAHVLTWLETRTPVCANSADLTISTTQLPEVTPPYRIVHFLHHYMICKLKTKPCNDNDNAKLHVHYGDQCTQWDFWDI